jgi:hypothetical protein
VNAFRDKYFAIPGDFKDATRFWGRLNSNSDCITNSSASVATGGVCDGNGNGGLTWPSAAAGQSNEALQFWRHLSISGLIEGNYGGLAGSGGGYHCPVPTACPASRLSNGGWSAVSLPNFSGDSWVYAMDYGNSLAFGDRNNGTSMPFEAALTPAEAWNIDLKLDDGKPAQGKVIAKFWNNLCAAADNGNSTLNNLVASYRLDDSSRQCALFFRQGF